MHKSDENRAQASSPQIIFDIVSGYQRSRALLTAFELGVFTALGGKSRTSAEVASEIGTDPRATDRLMNALCSLGLLSKQKGHFANAPVAARFLVKGQPEYMGNLMHSVHLWDTWSTLTEAVRKGTSVVEASVSERGDQWREAFISAMHWRASRQAAAIVGMLDLRNVRRVLDVGGGSGAFAMAFTRAGEGINAVVFDLPNVVPLTNRYINQEKMAGRVSTVAGDYKRDPFGDGFDLVFLSAIVHSNSLVENTELIEKCARSLNPGGQVVIVDFIMNEDRLLPAPSTFFALNMLVGTTAGDTYTESEIRSWLTDAGLSDISRQDTEFGTGLLIGRKKT